ncbi:hypothetical protein ZIOFF_016062 [Zingiber officinale]|uniref:CCHC-type domain-containing protein n=1 Tax=Zingiber officinale TaxID=94328 RepID=A0A8J5HKR6_ZINOF|nr:hypothetical protein ZIOFF_016062 [Zingiber officinale]
MWDYLKKIYNQSNIARRFQLELELVSYIPPKGHIVTQSVHETSKRDQFLMKLIKEFEAIKSNLMKRESIPLLDIGVGELLREEERLITQAVLEQKAQHSTPIPIAYAAQERFKGDIQCYSCKRFKHIATNCTNYCKKPRHIIKDCSTQPPKKSETT